MPRRHGAGHRGHPHTSAFVKNEKAAALSFRPDAPPRALPCLPCSARLKPSPPEEMTMTNDQIKNAVRSSWPFLPPLHAATCWRAMSIWVPFSAGTGTRWCPCPFRMRTWCGCFMRPTRMSAPLRRQPESANAPDRAGDRPGRSATLDPLAQASGGQGRRLTPDAGGCAPRRLADPPFGPGKGWSQNGPRMVPGWLQDALRRALLRRARPGLLPEPQRLRCRLPRRPGRSRRSRSPTGCW